MYENELKIIILYNKEMIENGSNRSTLVKILLERKQCECLPGANLKMFRLHNDPRGSGLGSMNIRCK